MSVVTNLSPVATVSVRNAWEHAPLFAADRQEKKTVAFLDSRSTKASKLQILLTLMISLFLQTIHMLREGDVSNA